MPKPELVLSNTTSFFGGNIETVFKNAKRFGFKYLEIIPYAWVSPEEILKLQEKYQVQIAGIHLPPVWKKRTFLEAFAKGQGIISKFFNLIWKIYLGEVESNPGLKLAKILQEKSHKPYLLIHTNIVDELKDEFASITSSFHIVVENIIYDEDFPEFYWEPRTAKSLLQEKRIPVGWAFDPAHYLYAIKKFPHLDMLETYKQISPEVIHIGYDNAFIPHLLPNKKERDRLTQMFKIHQPKYVVIESNPLVSIKKARKLLEELINEGGL